MFLTYQKIATTTDYKHLILKLIKNKTEQVATTLELFITSGYIVGSFFVLFDQCGFSFSHITIM